MTTGRLLFDLFVGMLIVARLSLLLVEDDLLEPFRQWIAEPHRRFDGTGWWWAYRVTGCCWCCSPYIAAATWALWRYAPAGAFFGVGFVCGTSLAAGIAGKLLE